MQQFRIPMKYTTKDKKEEIQIKMNLFMVVKYKNKSKLSSHNWFFNGFCQ